MTDDIVTRLREAATSQLGEYQLTMAPELCLAIANEIERLRADRDHWRSIAEQAVDNADQAVKLLEKLTGINRD